MQSKKVYKSRSVKDDKPGPKTNEKGSKSRGKKNGLKKALRGEKT